jgi:hypothetical protein
VPKGLAKVFDPRQIRGSAQKLNLVAALIRGRKAEGVEGEVRDVDAFVVHALFAPGAMATLDRFAAALEDAEDDMLQRLSAMTFKVAVLGAAGRPDVVAEDGPEDLTVTVEDAEAAIAVATRWRGYAEAFAERVGETAFERDVQRAFALLPRVGASIDRRTVAQRTHLRARELEEVERTLVMRGAISVEQRDKAQRGPAAGVWKRNGNA